MALTESHQFCSSKFTTLRAIPTYGWALPRMAVSDLLPGGGPVAGDGNDRQAFLEDGTPAEWGEQPGGALLGLIPHSLPVEETGIDARQSGERPVGGADERAGPCAMEDVEMYVPE
jgi:hypothetical protein